MTDPALVPDHASALDPPGRVAEESGVAGGSAGHASATPDAWAGVAAVVWASSAIGVAEFDGRRLTASNPGFARLVGDLSRIVTPLELVSTAQRDAFRAFLEGTDGLWRRGIFGIAADDVAVPADRVVWARSESDRLELVIETDADLSEKTTLPLLELVDDLADAQRRLTSRNLELQRALDALEAARREVRELRRFVPVCAWCRRIQVDANGTPEWLSIEAYLGQDQMWVTHSMCDACAAGLDLDERPAPSAHR